LYEYGKERKEIELILKLRDHDYDNKTRNLVRKNQALYLPKTTHYTSVSTGEDQITN